MSRLRLVAVVASSAVVGALVAAPPAAADRLVRTDPTGDVMYLARDGGLLDSPNTRDPDILRFVVVNGPQAVTIRLTYDNLRATNGRDTYGRIKTPGRKYFFESQQREDGRWMFSVSGGGGCRPARQHVDVKKDVIELRIPRGCLSDPRWVQAGLVSTGVRNGWQNFWDDPLRDDINPTLGDTLSRRIPTG